MVSKRHGSALVCSAIGAAAMGCTVRPGSCPEVNESAAPVDVSGVYRYQASDLLSLSGTIEFAQDGDRVRVVNTTYDLGGNRPLEGEAVIQGNSLQIQLVPRNGDADYRADVHFLFTANGETFCVGYSDTNGDAGEMGSFIGRRLHGRGANQTGKQVAER